MSWFLSQLQELTVFLYKMGIGKAKRVFFQNKYNRQFSIEKGIAKEDPVLLPGSGVNLNHHILQVEITVLQIINNQRIKSVFYLLVQETNQ